MMDAMNWMLKIDNWAPDLFIRNAERMLQNRPSVQLRLLDLPASLHLAGLRDFSRFPPEP
jgi:hypothetical protein